MKTTKLLLTTLTVTLLCACRPNAAQYESILDEVLSCMTPDSGDDIHLVDEDEKKLIETLRYHTGFGKIPDVRNLQDYLFAINENLIFNSSDGVEALRLEKDIYGPAADSLCAFVEYGGKYPVTSVMAAIRHLQDQYARAIDIDIRIGIGAAIWLNRFTEQAVKYCPDIRMLADKYDGVGNKYVGIIEMPDGEQKPVTNIVIADFNGERQILFGIDLLVNKVAASYVDKAQFLLYRDTAPEEFEALVLTSDKDGNPVISARTNWPETIRTIQDWISPALETGRLRLFHQNGCSLDLIVDKGDRLEARTLRYDGTSGSCRFAFDPDVDVSIEDKPCFREVFADLDGDTDALLDSLLNPSSPKWDNLFSVKEGFLKEYLPGEYSHCGKLLAIADGEEDVAIADYSKRRILPYRLKGDGSTVISIQFSPDDSKAVVQSWSGRIALFETKTGNLLKEIHTEESEIDIRIAFDWDKCEAYVGQGNKLLLLKLDENLSESVDSLKMPINSVLPYRDGTLLVSGCDGMLIYNPDTKSITRQIPFGYRGFRKVAISPNKRFILVYNPDGVINLWDTEESETYWTMDYLEGYGNSIGFSDDGTKFIFINGDSKSVTERTIYTNL